MLILERVRAGIRHQDGNDDGIFGWSASADSAASYNVVSYNVEAISVDLRGGNQVLAMVRVLAMIYSVRGTPYEGIPYDGLFSAG